MLVNAAPYVYVYVRMNVCIYILIYVCVCMYVSVCMCMYVCSCMYVRMHVCMYVCMYACMYVGMYVCKYVCMYLCMHICLNVLSMGPVPGQTRETSQGWVSSRSCTRRTGAGWKSRRGTSSRGQGLGSPPLQNEENTAIVSNQILGIRTNDNNSSNAVTMVIR